MKIINIQFNKKNISSNIKKESLNWAISFLKKKIKQSNYIKHEITSISYDECILLDNNSKIKKKVFQFLHLIKNIVK